MQPIGRPHDDRAITPVVAPVLLVAIVVPAGGVVGVNVFDIAEETEYPTPQAPFTDDRHEDTRTFDVTHTSVDTLTDGMTGRLLGASDDDGTGSNDCPLVNRSWVDDDTAASPVQSSPVESGNSVDITGENDTSGDLNVKVAGSNVDTSVGETHEPEVDDRVLVGESVVPAGEDPRPRGGAGAARHGGGHRP
jgi:hypothetical protein